MLSRSVERLQTILARALGTRSGALAWKFGRWVVVAWFVLYVVLDFAVDLRIGLDYDDTLAFSSPSFKEAMDQLGSDRWPGRNSPQFAKFWSTVYSHVDLDRPKWVPILIALAGKTIGCDVVIITARAGVGSWPLQVRWSWLVDEFYFTKEKAGILAEANYLVFLGDSDGDITEAQEAGVWAVRVERGEDSSNDREYQPGEYGEMILPFSAGPGWDR